MTDKVDKESIFEFLDCLRIVDAVNILAAESYIEDEFGVSENEARDMLVEWFECLDIRDPSRDPVEMLVNLKRRKVKLANNPQWIDRCIEMLEERLSIEGRAEARRYLERAEGHWTDLG